jgi:hypothetical protein
MLFERQKCPLALVVSLGGNAGALDFKIDGCPSNAIGIAWRRRWRGRLAENWCGSICN